MLFRSLDYFACGKLDVDAATEVIKGVANGCEQAGCALIGGETAEMPGMYPVGEYDLAGFAVGVVEKANIITGEHIKPGDVVLGKLPMARIPTATRWCAKLSSAAIPTSTQNLTASAHWPTASWRPPVST